MRANTMTKIMLIGQLLMSAGVTMISVAMLIWPEEYGWDMPNWIRRLTGRGRRSSGRPMAPTDGQTQPRK